VAARLYAMAVVTRNERPLASSWTCSSQTKLVNRPRVPIPSPPDATIYSVQARGQVCSPATTPNMKLTKANVKNPEIRRAIA
jgi:hypothetical protein